MQPARTHDKTEALAQLASQHADGVFRYLRSLVQHEDTARDLLQDTFLRLEPHAETAGPGLVFATARSCALDRMRRRNVRRRHHADLDAHTLAVVSAPSSSRPDRTVEADEFRRDLLEALAALPEQQRSVFHLSEIEGLPYAEIARILGVSPGTIASRKHHALRKLREYLGRRGHGA